MPVSVMLRQMDSAELTDWMAYWRVEPFGEERADLRSGIVSSVIASCMSASKKKYKPSDFMPDFGAKKKQTVEQMRVLIKQVSRAFNRGKVNSRQN